MKKVLYLSVILLTMMFVFGCKNDEVEEDTYTVDYVVDLSTYEIEVMENGNPIRLPKEPVKEGYTFKGWYTSNGWYNDYRSVIEFNPDGPITNENITFRAKWDINTYTISYTDFGGMFDYQKEITQEYGTDLTIPEPLNRTGYTFDGWYTDEAYTKAFVYDKMPASNLVIYQKWHENESFYQNDSPVLTGDDVVLSINKVYYEQEPTTEYKQLMLDIVIQNNTDNEILWLDQPRVSLTDSDYHEIAEFKLSFIPNLESNETYSAIKVIIPYHHIKKGDVDLSQLRWRVSMAYNVNE